MSLITETLFKHCECGHAPEQHYQGQNRTACEVYGCECDPSLVIDDFIEDFQDYLAGKITYQKLHGLPESNGGS